jgi:6-phosphogluconolactonase (cycloisomerase 2 family)
MKNLRSILASVSLILASLVPAACGGGGSSGGGATTPPAGLTYSSPTASYETCGAITPNTPSSTGGAIASYAILPALPAGLSLDPATGIISGTPTAAAVTDTYTITATNAAGDTTADVDLEVTTTAPTGLTYDDLNPSYAQGVAITANTPTLDAGTTANAYSVSAGTLPTGLSLDPTTGVISGTPTVLGAPTAVTIEAENCEGLTDDVVVTIEVVATALATRGGYVSNGDDDTISIFLQDPSNGQLRHAGYVHTGANTRPGSLLTSAAGDVLYAALEDSDEIAVYAIDALTAQLSEVEVEASGGLAPSTLVLHPNGDFLYALQADSNQIAQYSVTPGTGALTPLVPPVVATGAQPSSLVLTADGAYAYVSNSGADTISHYEIDGGTGLLTAIAPVASGATPSSLAVRGSDTLYCANGGAGTISAFTISAVDGTLSAVAGSPFASGVGPASVTLTGAGTTLYCANLGDNTVSQYSVDAGTGALTPLAPATVATGATPRQVVVDATNEFAYALCFGDNEVRAYSIGGGGALTASLPFSVRARVGVDSLALAIGAGAPDFVSDAVYVANNAGNDISQFSAAAGDGALTPLVPAIVSASPSPSWIEVHPHLDFAYVVNLAGGTDDVTTFPIGAGGALGAPITLRTGTGVSSLHIDPSGRFAFGTRPAVPGDVVPFTIDQVTGELTAGVTVAAQDITRGGAVHPNGKYFYVVNNVSNTVSQYEIDALTGALTPLVPATVATAGGPITMTVHPTGRFAYAINQGADSISMYEIDAASGALTALPSSPLGLVAGSDPFELAFTPNGRFAYLCGIGTADEVRIFGAATNPAAGEPGLLAGAGVSVPSADSRSLRVNHAGTALYVSQLVVAGTVEVFAITVGTGALTALDSENTGDTSRGLDTRDRVE